MSLATVVVEEHSGTSMQLRDDHTLRAIDHEGAVVGHERQLAQIHFLLAHVLHGLLRTRGLLVEHDEPHLGAQGRGIGETSQLAFLDVEHGLP